MILLEPGNPMCIQDKLSIRDAMKAMDNGAEGILFVLEPGGKLSGTLTDGDVRRALLNAKKMSDTIENIYNAKPFCVVQNDYNKDELFETMKKKEFIIVPVLDDGHSLIGYEKITEMIGYVGKDLARRQIDVPVIIMAGGKGTRMAPFTNVLPKPLIPIGEKTILELIIEEFSKFGVSEYYFTINYRGEMIRAYFDGLDKNYTVKYLREKEFWGTAGSLSLLPPDFSGTFIVSNCDIIVKADYAEVLEFHRASGASLTVLSSIQHHRIPYGVIQFENGGVVTELIEKPEYSFCINTGVYILEPECLALIKENEVFHMTHLMEALMKEGKKVVTYPVNEKDYIDIGQWEDYRKAITLLG